MHAQIRKSQSGIQLALKKLKQSDWYKYTLIIETLAIFTILQLMTSGTFLTTRNLSNLLMQGVTCSIIAITMVMIIVTCNADLAAGSIVGCLGTIAAVLQVKAGLGSAATIAITLVAGILAGAWHGYWIAYRKLPAFLVTLSGQLLFKGITLLVGQGNTIGPMSKSFTMFGHDYLPSIGSSGHVHLLSLLITLAILFIYLILSVRGRAAKRKSGLDVGANWKYWLKTLLIMGVCFAIASIMIFYRGFTYAIVILLILAGVFHFVITSTAFGRAVFAIGGNRDAARLSGINIAKTEMTIFVLHGLATAVAAIVFLGRIGQATAAAGTAFEFTAITGCIVGGTSIRGGEGNVFGAIMGTMLMAGLDNGMSLLNLGAEYQYVIKGIVLLLAVAIDVASKEKEV
ncbi:MAG: sugar ABC transporter permease [Lachnospiraceae bacterium]